RLACCALPQTQRRGATHRAASRSLPSHALQWPGEWSSLVLLLGWPASVASACSDQLAGGAAVGWYVHSGSDSCTARHSASPWGSGLSCQQISATSSSVGVSVTSIQSLCVALSSFGCSQRECVRSGDRQ